MMKLDSSDQVNMPRWILIVSAVINAVVCLAAAYLIAMDGRSQLRIAGVLFFATGGLALITTAILLRHARAKDRWSTWRAVGLAVPALLMYAAIDDRLPLWWPRWAGGPAVNAAVAEGPLSSDVRPDYRLPPVHLDILGADGASVSIRPSFGAVDYDLDIAPAGLNLPGRPTARLWVRPRKAPSREYRFHVPWEDIVVTLRAFDARAQSWHGARGWSTDGTSILVDRVQNGRTTSIHTNASPHSEPNNPAAQFRTDLHALMLAYGPTGAIPRSYDWHVDWSVDGQPCSERGLNTAAPDGASKEAACRLN